MAAKLPVQIIGQAYGDESAPWAAQETINWYPIVAETDGTRTPVAFKGCPGLSLFGTVGTGTVRGNITMAGVLYVVADTTLYSVASDGTETSIGTIEGSGRVGIAENGIQLIVVNGSKGWFYNRNTLSFGEITDADFPEADDCCFIGNYVACVDQDTDEWFISALSDVTSYDALDFAAAETGTDGLLGILPLNREVWLFGESTIEVWTNSGAADFPFERIAVIEKGLAATFAKAKLDNTVYWLGENGIVYRAQGYGAVRVSTGPIEQAIASETLSEAFAFAYEEAGHAFFVLTFPNGKTWVYDAATRMWHRRKSFESPRWRANTYVYAYNKHLVGDTTSGQMWELDSDVYTDAGDALIAERKTQYHHENGNPFSLSELELFFKPGVGLTTGQGSDPLVDVAYSGGRTFSNFRSVKIGKLGEYERRARLFRFGQFKGSVMLWIRVSDPCNRDLYGASARA
jgi:hypothetical protein